MTPAIDSPSEVSSKTETKKPGLVKIWIREMRLPFLTASITPVLLGTAIAWARSGIFALDVFLLTLIAGASLHIGANTSNDYFDHLSGADDINVEYISPFTGGSRMIQEGYLTPRAVLACSFVFFGIAVAIGFYFFLQLGWIIVILGLIGAGSGFFYTAPPIRLVSRGIGEIFIGLNFGVLMTLGSYYVQTAVLDWEPVWASVPIALLIAGVLYINEFPDCSADAAAGKKTIVVRLGKSRAAKGFAVMMAVVYISIVLEVLLNLVSPYMLLGLTLVPLTVYVVKVALKHHSETIRLVPANAGTIMTHLFMGLFLTAGYILSGLPLLPMFIVGATALMFVIVALLLRKVSTPLNP